MTRAPPWVFLSKKQPKLKSQFQCPNKPQTSPKRGDADYLIGARLTLWSHGPWDLELISDYNPLTSPPHSIYIHMINLMLRVGRMFYTIFCTVLLLFFVIFGNTQLSLSNKLVFCICCSWMNFPGSTQSFFPLKKMSLKQMSFDSWKLKLDDFSFHNIYISPKLCLCSWSGWKNNI